jgi:hypothetical protein
VGRVLVVVVLWQTLDLDVFWAERLPPSRKGTRWDLVPLRADRHRVNRHAGRLAAGV